MRVVYLLQRLRKMSRSSLAILITAGLLAMSACGDSTGKGNTVKQQAVQQPDKLINGQQSQATADHAFIPGVQMNHGYFVALDDLVAVLQLNGEWNEDGTQYSIGDYGTDTTVTVGSQTAMQAEEPVKLAKKPVVKNKRVYVSLQDAVRLFEDGTNIKAGAQGLNVYPTVQNTRSDLQDNDFFKDDPNDPFANSTSLLLDSELSDLPGLDAEQALPVAALKNINMSTVIATAKRYKGVKYKFGAAPYAKSRRFDCSSFTRFIFAKQGVYLPRTARAQSKRGVAVSRKNLRKGDLLFFYVPGRFKSNRVVGHVGIYMGNHRMIHSSPIKNKGVQISNINNTWWKKTFLKARRVAI